MSLGLDSLLNLKKLGHAALKWYLRYFLELLEWAAKRSGYSTAEIQMLLRDAGYHLYRGNSRELVPIAEGAFVYGEYVIACARTLDLVTW